MDNNAGAPNHWPGVRRRCIVRGPRRSRRRGRYTPAVQPDQAMELRAFSQDTALLRVRLRALLRDPNSNLDQVTELLNVIGKAIGIPDNCWDDR